MKKGLLLITMALLCVQCIPLRIAPNITEDTLKKGNRFRRGLPKKTLFVFEDPKEEYHFYNYINTKFQLDDHYVDVEVPFEVDGQSFYFSFYEVEISDKGINLFPFVFDVFLNASLGNEEFEPYTSENTEPMIRRGNWYIAIEVFSKEEKDCLHEKSNSRNAVLAYLRSLKKEYLATHNYNEVVFKN